MPVQINLLLAASVIGTLYSLARSGIASSILTNHVFNEWSTTATDRPTVRLCGPVCPSSVFSPTTVTVSYKFESRRIVGQAL